MKNNISMKVISVTKKLYEWVMNVTKKYMNESYKRYEKNIGMKVINVTKKIYEWRL